MLRFVLSNAGGPFEGDRPSHLHLFGPEEVPIPAQFRVESGQLLCERAGTDAAGLSLQLPLDRLGEEVLNNDEAAGRIAGLGVLKLRTCLLPDRERPYLLSLELARHRIMQFLNKLEDWALFDLSADDPVVQQFERARTAFTEALVRQRSHSDDHPLLAGAYPVETDRLAYRSLVLAVDAGERLALRDAARRLPIRLAGKLYEDAAERFEAIQQERPPKDAPIMLPGANGVVLPSRPLLGCSVSPAPYSEERAKALVSSVDFVSMPMRWADMEPTEGKYAFSTTDRWIEWAVRKAKLPIAAGPLVDFRAAAVPDWLYIWENDYETLRELVVEHVKQIVTRYRRTVKRWTVASGLHVNTQFRLGFEQMMDLTRLSVHVVRRLHPGASVAIELTQPWGEYYAFNRRSLPPYLYADMLTQAGIQVDAFALRLQMGQPVPGQATRDLMDFSSLLDRYARLERPIIISSLGVPSATLSEEQSPIRQGSDSDEGPESGDEDGFEADRDGEEPVSKEASEDLAPGFWRGRWNEQLQADWLASATAVALAKPFVHSVCWQELSDASAQHEMSSGGILQADGTPKPAFRAMMQIRQALREGRVPGFLNSLSEDRGADWADPRREP